MVCGPNYVVCDCGKQLEFQSWTEMVNITGGLEHIVHTPTLCAEMKLAVSLPITA